MDMQNGIYRRLIFCGLVFFVVVSSANEVLAQRTKIVTWNIQCFLEHKLGECRSGRPIRMEVRAKNPDLARKIANTAGQRKKQWSRCFRVARKKRQLPTCDPKTGRTVR
ncbi:MAG: hypothetical protein VX941_11160 [Pseudomonadota bacterium]|nr:hypothetical protein [Pseudomonadota bacterium]